MVGPVVPLRDIALVHAEGPAHAQGQAVAELKAPVQAQLEERALRIKGIVGVERDTEVVGQFVIGQTEADLVVAFASGEQGVELKVGPAEVVFEVSQVVGVSGRDLHLVVVLLGGNSIPNIEREVLVGKLYRSGDDAVAVKTVPPLNKVTTFITKGTCPARASWA